MFYELKVHKVLGTSFLDSIISSDESRILQFPLCFHVELLNRLHSQNKIH